MIRDALDHADDLLDDEHLDENEKEKIREYISEMRIKLKELHKDAYDEEERYFLIRSWPITWFHTFTRKFIWYTFRDHMTRLRWLYKYLLIRKFIGHVFRDHMTRLHSNSL